ncbi:hypothetical protein, partial [Propionivibrio sp.]|uniref:hypothetical protein n=1 Tax=Propionivibrio sp. TaxID=2212460 RepID=UPI003BF366BC
ALQGASKGDLQWVFLARQPGRVRKFFSLRTRNPPRASMCLIRLNVRNASRFTPYKIAGGHNESMGSDSIDPPSGICLTPASFESALINLRSVFGSAI